MERGRGARSQVGPACSCSRNGGLKMVRSCEDGFKMITNSQQTGTSQTGSFWVLGDQEANPSHLNINVQPGQSWNYRILQTIDCTLFFHSSFIQIFTVISHVCYFHTDNRASALLPVTYQFNTSEKSWKKVLQVLKPGAGNRNQRKRRFLDFRCWQSCSKATRRRKNSTDLSDLKWAGQFVSMFLMLQLPESLFLSYTNVPDAYSACCFLFCCYYYNSSFKMKHLKKNATYVHFFSPSWHIFWLVGFPGATCSPKNTVIFLSNSQEGGARLHLLRSCRAKLASLRPLRQRQPADGVIVGGFSTKTPTTDEMGWKWRGWGVVVGGSSPCRRLRRPRLKAWRLKLIQKV